MQIKNTEKEVEKPKIKKSKNLTIIKSGKTLLLLESLMNYYKKNINILSCIITQKSTLSLRILDWLVTNYSKKYNIVYKNNNTDNFNIYLEYKNQLKAYSKKYFDPFCRRERIMINTSDLTWKDYETNETNESNEIQINNSKTDELITTVGQLNFFKWFIENGVMNYAIQNIEKIDKDMIETLSNSKNSPKRKELSKCASKTVCTYNSVITVTF